MSSSIFINNAEPVNPFPPSQEQTWRDALHAIETNALRAEADGHAVCLPPVVLLRLLREWREEKYVTRYLERALSNLTDEGEELSAKLARAQAELEARS